MFKKDKIKIIFLLPSLGTGGAERVISFVAQNINKDKFDPILLIAGSKLNSVYEIGHVNIIYLNKKRILTAIPSIVHNIFKIKPNIVVSSISHVNTAMSFISPFFKKIKFIGREATVLSQRKNEKKTRRWSPLHLINFGYKNLHMIICQSEDMAIDMELNYKIPKNKICIINNPISDLVFVKQTNINKDIKKFITVGRLKDVKGHLRILEILSKLKVPFEYTIIGDGDLKEEIFNKAKALKIFQHIIHIPFTNKVSDFIAENDMFLQGSYVEGFPNAVLESCVVGTPVIAFSAPGGTKEIIVNGLNGFIVENKELYLKKLEENINWDPYKIRSSVIEKFNKEKIITQYEQLFVNILKNKN